MKRILGIEDMRGERVILDTRTFFCNDNEKVQIMVKSEGGFIDLEISFEPTKEVNTNPPIDIESIDNKTIMNFKGWNHAITYAALDPIELGRWGRYLVTFSVLNMYLNGTNHMNLQFYAEFSDE